jgi:acetolactate synthase-1/2/3 large subunit
VVAIDGDGCFQMTAQELATCAIERLPIKVMIFNNGFLGMVRQWQELFWRRRYSQVELANPDFVKLAEAYGCTAYRATRTADVEDVLRKAMAHTDGPVFVEFVVAKEDNVYPMIPAGQTVNEMIDTPDPAAGGGPHPGNGVETVEKGKARKVSVHAPVPSNA